MSLTKREHKILELAKQGLNDTKIARKLHLNPQSVNRSHKNALKKLTKFQMEIEWANKKGLTFSVADCLEEILEKHTSKKGR